jgi:hypothetical protein
LADPQMTCKLWLDAAKKIISPVGHPPATKSLNGVPDIVVDDTRPMAGEVLRGMKNPSVTEVLVKRSDDSARLAKLAESGFDWGPVCELTTCLAKWDHKAAVPVIHRRFADLFTSIEDDFPFQGHAHDLTAPVANMIDAGLQAGEDDLLVHDYVAWMRATTPSDFHFFEPLVFMPLWRHPDNAKMAELARWLFLAQDSPWHPLHELKPIKWEEAITSPLVGVPAFRELLKRELANTSPIGDFQVCRGGLSTDVRNSGGGRASYYAPDVDVPESGVKGPLRACDYYAAEVSRLEGSPRYEMYWSEKRREAAGKEMSRFLDQWGNCFRDRGKSIDSYYDDFALPKFRLSRLPHPATPEDVAAGRAIFSLCDRPDAKVRVIDLKSYPAIGRWKTLQQFRLLNPVPIIPPGTKEPYNEKFLNGLPKELYDREGFLWQAEEVLIDGKWRRYYGFVGRHIIAKVPGEEIEVLGEFTDAHPPW